MWPYSQAISSSWLFSACKYGGKNWEFSPHACLSGRQRAETREATPNKKSHKALCCKMAIYGIRTRGWNVHKRVSVHQYTWDWFGTSLSYLHIYCNWSNSGDSYMVKPWDERMKLRDLPRTLTVVEAQVDDSWWLVPSNLLLTVFSAQLTFSQDGWRSFFNQ